jgi:hypothetical protein
MIEEKDFTVTNIGKNPFSERESNLPLISQENVTKAKKFMKDNGISEDVVLIADVIEFLKNPYEGKMLRISK